MCLYTGAELAYDQGHVPILKLLLFFLNYYIYIYIYMLVSNTKNYNKNKKNKK